jgi:hypothetical protein
MKRLLLIALLCCACDPGDDAWNGTAPPAPNAPDDAGCDDEVVEDVAPVESSSDKHSGAYNQGANGGGGTGHWWDQCSTSYWPYQAACWRWNDPYNRVASFANVTPYGQPGHTWSVQHVSWSYCYGGLPPSAIAANSAIICMPGHCVDISNVGIQANGCRSGNTFFPVTVAPNSYTHAELLIRMQDGWMPWEMWSPEINIWHLRVSYFH